MCLHLRVTFSIYPFDIKKKTKPEVLRPSSFLNQSSRSRIYFIIDFELSQFVFLKCSRDADNKRFFCLITSVESRKLRINWSVCSVVKFFF